MRVAVVMVNDFPEHVIQLGLRPESETEGVVLTKLQTRFQQERIEAFKQRRSNNEPEAHPFEVGRVHVHAFDLK
jgi:hypothetical protein